jgi:hypothetical protein
MAEGLDLPTFASGSAAYLSIYQPCHNAKRSSSFTQAVRCKHGLECSKNFGMSPTETNNDF